MAGLSKPDRLKGRTKVKLAGLVWVAVVVGWSCAGPKPAPKTKATDAPIELTMPSGWSDTILEKIKRNESPKSVIAVLDFEGNEKLQGKVALKLSDMLTTVLVKTGRFDVVERNKMDRVLKEQGLKMTGLVAEASMVAEAGKLLGAETVVFGVISSATAQTIDKFSYDLIRIQVQIDVRAVNTTTGKIVLSEKAMGRTDSKIIKTGDGIVVSGALDYATAYAQAVQRAVDSVGEKISGLFPLMGFIVQVSGDQVFTDVGEERGVRKGDVFIVFRVGDEVVHPSTGVHLGWAKSILGAVRIVSPEENMSSGTIIQKAEGAGEIMLGDLIIAR